VLCPLLLIQGFKVLLVVINSGQNAPIPLEINDNKKIIKIEQNWQPK